MYVHINTNKNEPTATGKEDALKYSTGRRWDPFCWGARCTPKTELFEHDLVEKNKTCHTNTVHIPSTAGILHGRLWTSVPIQLIPLTWPQVTASFQNACCTNTSVERLCWSQSIGQIIIWTSYAKLQGVSKLLIHMNNLQYFYLFSISATR